MREIKFRGLSVNGDWYYGLLSISQGHSGQPAAGYYISNKAGMPWAYHVRPDTVGQYIDQIDKNGVKVYEGDVVRLNGDVAFDGLQTVVWDDEMCGFSPYCDQILCAADSYSEWSIEFSEVIGNIYDNPELLK
jgi:hypothetical protein